MAFKQVLQVILMEGWGWPLLQATPPIGIVISVLTFKKGLDVDYDYHLSVKSEVP